MSRQPAPARTPSQKRVRTAITVWFAVVLAAVVLADLVATLDPRLVAAIVVVAVTTMFTCMQIVMRETYPRSRVEVSSVREFRERPVSGLVTRNLAIVSALYLVLWLLGGTPS